MEELQGSHQPPTYNVLDRIYKMLRRMQRRSATGSLNSEDACKDIDEALANLTRMESSSDLPNEDLKTAIVSIKEFKEALLLKINSHKEPEINKYDRTKPKPHSIGRPEFEIDMGKLQQLLDLGFTVKQIANDGLLGGVLHPNTLLKKLKEHKLNKRSSYSNIGDEELQELAVKYKKDHPNAGALEIQAYLKAKGHTVQRQRCRDVLRRAGLVGIARRSSTIKRPQNDLPTARSVWHLGTQHSLARWGIYVHGAIDEYSRFVPFMRASTHNTSSAAACFFVEGVKYYGVPSRVRADDDSKFADTERFMVEMNGEETGRVLTGPSVHKQRIEKIWKDVYTKVIDAYYKLLQYMEDDKVLDVDNEEQMWVLQYVFTPRIDASLKEWMMIHNNRKLITENNRTPKLLWFQSSLLSNPGKSKSSRNIESLDKEKIETAIQRLSLELDATSVLIPGLPCPLTNEAMQDLAGRIEVNKESESKGLDVFREVMIYVLSKQ